MKELMSMRGNADVAVGEVLSINSFYIDVFIYPEHLSEIRIGDILAVATDWGFALGPVLETSYRAQRSFRALKVNMDKLKRAIPDIYKFHIIFTRLVYTSHFNGKELIHARGPTPLLHSLAYKLDSEPLLDMFFGYEDWHLDFIRIYVSMGADTLIFRHFIETHRGYLSKKVRDKDEFIKKLSRALARAPKIDPAEYLIEVHEALRW